MNNIGSVFKLNLELVDLSDLWLPTWSKLPSSLALIITIAFWLVSLLPSGQLVVLFSNTMSWWNYKLSCHFFAQSPISSTLWLKLKSIVAYKAYLVCFPPPISLISCLTLHSFSSICIGHFIFSHTHQAPSYLGNFDTSLLCLGHFSLDTYMAYFLDVLFFFKPNVTFSARYFVATLSKMQPDPKTVPATG